MQNSSFKKQTVCGIVNPSSSAVTPQCNHGLSLVTPSGDHSVTAIKPDHTPVTLPTHTGLSLKQALVFEHLERTVSRQTNYNTIAAAFGLSKPAARGAVSGLLTKKYITDFVIIRSGAYQGFTYKIDGEKCLHFLAEGGSSNPIYLASNYTITPSTHTVCAPSDHIRTHSSSICTLENKLTTETVDLTDPEMLWWVDLGLTAKHIKTWIGEFNMSPESLVQSLRSAKFDVVTNGVKANGKPIENPLNWIYKILQKSGTYPRPKNYKSIIELRADELEDQLQRDAIAKAKILESEFEVKFREFMNDKESTLYLELLGSVTDFARDNLSALEIDMRETFRKRIGIQSTL